MKSFNCLSLFSGAGGDTTGIESAGSKVLFYNEFWKKARETHEMNFPDSQLIAANENDADISKIPNSKFEELKDTVELIFAGFPCQGFSNGGKKKANDPRNSLFLEFIRATNIIRPNYIIGENVSGLLTRKTDSNEKYIDVIVREFERIGYKITYKVCTATDFGVPQKRKRLIIVGIRNDIDKTFTFPTFTTNTEPDMRDIIEFSMKGSIKVEKEDFDMSKIPSECVITNLTNDETEKLNEVHPYLKLKAKEKNCKFGNKTHPNSLSFSKRDSPIHCEIIDIRKPCKTIICTYERQPRLFVPLRNKNGYYIRCLLPNELKQIQGFPKDYKILGTDKEQIKQIGNAVPPQMIKKIVEILSTFI